ncbi:unnamed protein product [Diamesa serratosioi]
MGLKMFNVVFILISFSFSLCHAGTEINFQTQDVTVAELFTLMISPELFNWTSQDISIGLTEQFRYRPSIKGRPTLPSWMNFQFSRDRNLGYLYGSPIEKQSNKLIEIEIVALNKQNYETRRIIIPFKIIHKSPPVNIIQMKITNLNWVHLTDMGRVENLKNIFRNELWPESKNDLSIVFMESAVKLGARIPLRPQQKEGVIVHLGSNAKYSQDLLKLKEEIKPLSKLTTCDYKRTSVQTTFENLGFKLDWCTFKISIEEQMNPDENNTEEAGLHSHKIWHGLSKDELPERNYSEEMALAIAIPSVWFAFLVAILTVVLCFHHEKFDEQQQTKTVQMVQYSGNDSNPTTTLKSLHDPATYEDNLSLGSQSPGSSLYLENSPRHSSSLRPKPPAYKGKAGEPSSSTIHFDNSL